MKTPTISFRSAAKYPYISMVELCDMINAAAKGQSSWTTNQVRETLRKAGALAKIPEDQAVDAAAIPAKFRRRTARRRFYTTPELLLSRLGSVFSVLFEAMSDEDAAATLGNV